VTDSSLDARPEGQAAPVSAPKTSNVAVKEPLPTHEKWKTAFAGISALSAISAVLLAIWGVFFSPLSKKLEEYFRTEVTLARQELITAREAKATVEAEKNRLLSDTKQLAAIRDQLSSDIDLLRKDRAAYAKSTRAGVDARYIAMVRYELEVTAHPSASV